ncbi:MAG: hypothetical protein JOZ69_09055 [Myxococcales bacterium]|nr:hypothetical protein [Myxococcales bacterium]
MTSAIRLFDHGDYGAAADAFAQAYAARPTEKALWNWALSEELAGRYYAAAVHLRQYQADPTARADHLARAGELLALARQHIAELAIDAPAGFVVTLDGRAVGSAPLGETVDADPDVDHVVGADAAAAHLRVRVPRPGPGPLQVRLEPPQPASVAADGANDRRDTPPVRSSSKAPAPAGTASSSDRPFFARNVAVVTLGGLAVVSAAVGLAFHVAQQNEIAHWQALSASVRDNAAAQQVDPTMICNPAKVSRVPAACGPLNDSLARISDETTWRDRFLVAAGSLAVVAAVTFLVWPRSRPERGSSGAYPKLGARGGQVVLGASF